MKLVLSIKCRHFLESRLLLRKFFFKRDHLNTNDNKNNIQIRNMDIFNRNIGPNKIGFYYLLATTAKTILETSAHYANFVEDQIFRNKRMLIHKRANPHCPV